MGGGGLYHRGVEMTLSISYLTKLNGAYILPGNMDSRAQDANTRSTLVKTGSFCVWVFGHELTICFLSTYRRGRPVSRAIVPLG